MRFPIDNSRSNRDRITYLLTCLLARYYDVIGHLTSRFAICHFLLVIHWNLASISNGFRDILSQTSRADRHMLNRHCACAISRVPPMYNLSTYFNFSPQSAQSLCHFHWPPMKNKGFSFSGPLILKAKSSEIFKPKICPNFGLYGAWRQGV